MHLCQKGIIVAVGFIANKNLSGKTGVLKYIFERLRRARRFGAIPADIKREGLSDAPYRDCRLRTSSRRPDSHFKTERSGDFAFCGCDPVRQCRLWVSN